DVFRCPATNHHHERHGIATATIAKLHAVDGDWRSSALAARRTQLLRAPDDQTETFPANSFGSGHPPSCPRRLMRGRRQLLRALTAGLDEPACVDHQPAD